MEKTNFAYAIAGSESTGAAGIQTDLRTFAKYGVYGLGCLTCIVSFDPENDWGHLVFPVPTETIEQQFTAANAAYDIRNIKIGMLGSTDTINTVGKLLATKNWDNIILDPVLICKGQEESAALSVDKELIRIILPMANIITPNLVEAEILSGIGEIKGEEDMKEAARLIYELGPKHVVIKGGARFSSDKAIDLYYDGKDYVKLSSELISNVAISGAGCTFASAITAGVANGSSELDAIKKAKEFVANSIKGRVQTPAPFASINQLNA
jgi:pyridoxine kinase